MIKLLVVLLSLIEINILALVSPLLFRSCVISFYLAIFILIFLVSCLRDLNLPAAGLVPILINLSVPESGAE